MTASLGGSAHKHEGEHSDASGHDDDEHVDGCNEAGYGDADDYEYDGEANV